MTSVLLNLALTFVLSVNKMLMELLHKSTNLPEDKKSEPLKAEEAHLLGVKLQCTHYNESCSKAKMELEKFLESASSTDQV